MEPIWHEGSRIWDARMRMPLGTLQEWRSHCCPICGVQGSAIRFTRSIHPRSMLSPCRGGQIFVMSGLLEFVESEAELAAVLGHEMSHVDLRHCIEHYQYEAKLSKARAPELGGIVEMAHRLVTAGFSPQQELEADAQGERLSVESGYDPDAEAALFARMKTKFHEPSRVQATTPAGEVTEAAGEAIGSYFRTHPPSEERVARLNDMLARHRRELAGRPFYVGKENLRERVPKSSHEYVGEFHEMNP